MLDLVEREAELEKLRQLMGAAIDGRGAVVWIGGSAGIGKSRLLTELRSAALDRGALALMARCSELEQEFAFGAVRQLFEERVRQAEPAAPVLRDASQPAQAVFETSDTLSGASGREAPFAVLHALLWLALDLSAPAGLVLMVDDLQWCDTASLRFFAYLVRRLEGTRILFAASVRTTEPGSEPSLLAEIAKDPLTVSIRPAALSEAGVGRLVRARLGQEPEPQFQAAVHRASAGNPLMLEQLLGQLHRSDVRPDAQGVKMVDQVGSQALAGIVRERLARLERGEAAVAEAIAILGDGATVAATAALAETSEAEVGRASATLVQAEILDSGSPLRFVHPLVRAAVQSELAPGSTELLHARAAELLIEQGASDDEIASHLLALPPGGRGWLAERLLGAARSAIRRGAVETAARYLRRALDEPPSEELRAEVLYELGMALTATNAEAAVGFLQDAEAALEDPVLRARAQLKLAQSLLFVDRTMEASQVLRRAMPAIPEGAEDLRLAFRAMEEMAVGYGRPRPPEADAGPASLEATAGARMLQAATAFRWASLCRPAEQCVQLALTAVSDDLLFELDQDFAVYGAIVTLTLADREEAPDVLALVEADAVRRGSSFGLFGIHCWGSLMALRRGQLAEAEELAEQLRSDMAAYSGETGMLALLAEVLVERGSLDEAREQLQDWPSLLPGSMYFFAYFRALTELELASGRPLAARAGARELAKASDTSNPVMNPWRSQEALALLQLGDLEGARTSIEAELEDAREWGAPSALGRALRIRGLIDGESGVGDLQAAVRILEPSPARLELAKALLALGVTLRAAGRWPEAQLPLRRAQQVAGVCGATPVAERAAAELAAGGAARPLAPLLGVDALTARERRVVDLAARGQTNREIAQTLFITPKTVEVHLSSAYRKLGVTSRHDLPGILGAEGLVDDAIPT